MYVQCVRGEFKRLIFNMQNIENTESMQNGVAPNVYPSCMESRNEVTNMGINAVNSTCALIAIC